MCRSAGAGRRGHGGAFADGSAHADPADRGPEAAAEIPQARSRRCSQGRRRLRSLRSAALAVCSRRFSSAQVPTGRKGGAFPGQQFSLDGGDEDEDGDDTAVLERKVHGANMPEAALKVCLKELKRCVWSWLSSDLSSFSNVLVFRLKKMPPSMPEYALTRNYLDLMVDLPWNRSTKGRRRSTKVVLVRCGYQAGAEGHLGDA